MTQCEQIQQRLPEYWAATISVKDHKEIESHIAGCGACRAQADALGKLWRDLDLIPGEPPGPQMRGRFYQMLDAYRSGVEERKPTNANWFARWFPVWQPVTAAALAMLAVGFFAGRQFAPMPQPADPQVAQLRLEVTNMRQMVALSLLQQQSASERMRGVTLTSTVDKSDREVVSALLSTVKSDPSVNVRLAAVEAFKNFGSNVAARRALLESLAAQDSPLVQIAIIELLVDMNDQTAVKPLQAYAGDGKLSREVQERARWAVGQLH